MTGWRIHVTGASGSGTSTLAAALAEHLALTYLDADDYYWLPTQPPYQLKRTHAERFERLWGDVGCAQGVVLSGSIMGWGEPLENTFDLIVFLYLPTAQRQARLRARELAKLGHVNEAFITWAGQYDEGPPEGRSLARHNTWLAQRTCPMLRLERDEAVGERLAHVLSALGHLSGSTPSAA